MRNETEAIDSLLTRKNHQYVVYSEMKLTSLTICNADDKKT